MNTQRWRLLLISLTMLAALLAGGIALAQGSGAAIAWWVISGGGAPSAGGSVTLNDTLGQPIIGPSSGGNTALGAGYWYGTGFDGTLCGLAEDITYSFNQNPPVQVSIQTLGTIQCMRVRRYDQNHSNPTGSPGGSGVGWGRYWLITATDSGGSPAGGFSLTLTLPHNDLAGPKACRWLEGSGPGYGWDCDDGSHTTFTTSTVTRSAISSLSEWAVGNNVGPTAVGLGSLKAQPSITWLKIVLGLAGLALVVCIGIFLIGRKRPSSG